MKRQKRTGVIKMNQQTTSSEANIERRILRRPEVEAKTGFKRAHIYNMMSVGKFPQAIRIGVRAVGWDSVEIEEWLTERRNERS
ncbi:transcriptional regulator, AlpA family [Halopseudomonas litoralis]|uniref:Transcriptional regulator, AlpA family n=2 Tax=Halopseudomonas litoralis TaxID=797277 RepID=A0A1H1PZ26_9GAMM|nr:transcriptional regulator, AlpA family [Halopseudomonas litoralis]